MGRSILDGVAIAQEVVHQCRKSGKDGYLLKLDFEKTYDKVDLDRVLKIMRNRGFGPKWINWVTIWLHSAKVAVLTNGELEKEIICKRGQLVVKIFK